MSRRRRRLNCEGLEKRYLLAGEVVELFATTDPAQTLTVTLTDADQTVTLTFTGPGEGTILSALGPHQFIGIGALSFEGGNGDDFLVINLNGQPLPTGGIQFNGGGQSNNNGGDTLTILNSANPATQQVLNYTTVGPDGKNGTIELDGGPLIVYTGLEPINAGNAFNTILNLPGGVANNATLQDSAVPGSVEIIDNGATF